jgi:hypothetical protein
MRSAGQKTLVLFVLGAFLLNYPVLAVFDRSVQIGGIPILVVYLFGVWVAGILIAALLGRGSD